MKNTQSVSGSWDRRRRCVMALMAALGSVVICAHRAAAELPGPVADYRAVVKSTDLESYSRAALAYRKWSIKNDPYRPLYHFTGVESWINDPNGPIYHDGKYHLFYQFDPQVPDGKGGWARSQRCWGHAVSCDLVHWKD
ncbi:MAG: hypothetical protein NTV46_11115, partial [Verrucomicrobia bacterium]|nr:hypothetical protein [Verrucomicrobiota bacterium]